MEKSNKNNQEKNYIPSKQDVIDECKLKNKKMMHFKTPEMINTEGYFYKHPFEQGDQQN